MDPVVKQITQDIDSGKYFSEAREWYSNIFVRPSYECATMYIYTVCALVILAVSTYNVFSVYPGTKNVMIVTKLSSTMNNYPVVRELHQDYSKQVAEFITTQFVKAKESYIPEKFEESYKFVYRNASKKLFDSYNKYISPQNPKSPVSLYGWNGKIVVDIKKVQHNGSNNITVFFTKKGLNNYNNILFTQNLVASINYRIEKLNFRTKSKNKIDFVVDNYVLKELKADTNVKK